MTTTTFELSIPMDYIETTIPPGMTVTDYRRSRPQPGSWWQRLGRFGSRRRPA